MSELDTVLEDNQRLRAETEAVRDRINQMSIEANTAAHRFQIRAEAASRIAGHIAAVRTNQVGGFDRVVIAQRAIELADEVLRQLGEG